MTEATQELPPIEKRPLVTFVLFAYNQEKYIQEAVRGALSQDYRPLQIILSDDCSTDRTFEIMQEEAKSAEIDLEVVLNRSPKNLGICDHLNQIMRLTRGELIIGAAGDDISASNRTSVLVEHWVKNGKRCGSIYSSFEVIDCHGNVKESKRFDNSRLLNDAEQRAKGFIRVVGPTHAWSIDLFKRFGPIVNNAVNEDAVLQFRASLCDGIDVISDVLVRYRIHDANISRTTSGFGSTSLHQNEVYSRIQRVLDNHIVAVSKLVKEDSSYAKHFKENKLLRILLIEKEAIKIRQDGLNLNRIKMLRLAFFSLRLGRRGVFESGRLLLLATSAPVYEILKRVRNRMASKRA